MTTKLGYVTVDCADARSLAPFWASALGWEVTYEADDGAVLADPGGGDPKLFLQTVPEPKSGKNRVHVDLVADDFDAHLDRLRSLGATVLRTDQTPDGKPSAVLADPQGNEFCLA
jgi:predicted enzyme related to lactoylglutathione lyase